MRLAISAVAAVSGLLLLGLSIYGQPAVYLHQAREQWNSLMDESPPEPTAAPDHDAAGGRVAQLQQRVVQLEDELASKPEPAQPASLEAVAPSASAQPRAAELEAALAAAPPAVAPLSGSPPGASGENPAPPAVDVTQTAPPQGPAVAPPVLAPLPTPPPVPPAPPAALPATAVAPAVPQSGPGAATGRPDFATARGTAPGAPAAAVPERHEPGVAGAVSSGPAPATANAAGQQPGKGMAARTAAGRSDATKPAPAPSGVDASAKTEAARVRPETPSVDGAQNDAARNDAARTDAARADAARADAARNDAARADAARNDAAKADVAKADAARAVAARNDAARSDAARADAARSDAARNDVARTGSARGEVSRAESAKPAPQKLALARPPPPPPPPVRQEQPDDAQSVLARLRQLAAPGVAPEQPDSPPVESRPRLASSPTMPKLSAARAALAAGRIEDARRLLQEAQLQLVFRPVNGAGDESPGAARSSADVAHALDALSGNDVPLSRRYIDVATADLSGAGGREPVQQTQIRANGYAPAYPPR